MRFVKGFRSFDHLMLRYVMGFEATEKPEWSVRSCQLSSSVSITCTWILAFKTTEWDRHMVLKTMLREETQDQWGKLPQGCLRSNKWIAFLITVWEVETLKREIQNNILPPEYKNGDYCSFIFTYLSQWLTQRTVRTISWDTLSLSYQRETRRRRTECDIVTQYLAAVDWWVTAFQQGYK